MCVDNYFRGWRRKFSRRLVNLTGEIEYIMMANAVTLYTLCYCLTICSDSEIKSARSMFIRVSL